MKNKTKQTTVSGKNVFQSETKTLKKAIYHNNAFLFSRVADIRNPVTSQLVFHRGPIGCLFIFLTSSRSVQGLRSNSTLYLFRLHLHGNTVIAFSRCACRNLWYVLFILKWKYFFIVAITFRLLYSLSHFCWKNLSFIFYSEFRMFLSF